MLNNFQIVGHIGNIKTRSTKNGGIVAVVNVATNRSRKVNDEWKTETDWHQVTLFGRLAERAEKQCSPGMLFISDGSIRQSSYDKDGTTVYTTDLVANSASWKRTEKSGKHIPIDDE